MAGVEVPPGTQRIHDVAGQHLVLAPQPTSDPNQPLNWSTRRKGIHLAILCFYTLMAFSFLTIPVPLWTIFSEELGLSFDDLNNAFAVSQVTLATGCIIFIPLAARYGRRPVYIASGLVLIATGIWSARTETNGDNYGTCVLLGLASCVNEALFQVSVSDLFFVHQRGTINGLYVAIQMAGTYFAPVASGYVAESSLGWRWTFYISTIAMAVCVILMICFLEETKYFAATIEGQTADRSAAEAVDMDNKVMRQESSISRPSDNSDGKQLVNQGPCDAVEDDGRLLQINHDIVIKSYRERLALATLNPDNVLSPGIWTSLSRPFIILFTFPAVLFTAVQYGFLIAMICILSITQATIYAAPPYNFSAAGIGNMNIAPAIGCIIGSIFGGPVNDYFIRRIARKRDGIYEPETRLWLFLFPGVFLPAGTFLYGLTIAKGMPWPINALGAGFIGFAIGGCGDIVLTYCQDCYQHIIGEALTGVVFVRNIVSCPLVFAINPWQKSMGIYNMFVLLGCFAVGIIMTSVPLIVWGRSWRIKCAPKYEKYSAGICL